MNREIEEYIVVYFDQISHGVVNNRISEGWQPYGSPFNAPSPGYTNGWTGQAMVKYKKPIEGRRPPAFAGPAMAFSY